MRTSVDRSSPWGQRLWFEDHEFDAMMDEVRIKAGQLLTSGPVAVDPEAILERVYGVVPDYVDLPSGVLGKTIFYPSGKFDVFVSRELADAAESDEVVRRRMRATVAHECGHVVVHGHLHLVDSLTGSLFGDATPPAPKVLCRQESVDRAGYDGQWWEYQANRGMASLLLPKRPLGGFVRSILEERGWGTLGDAIALGETESVIRQVMEAFDVSMQLAIFRLQELGLLPKSTAQTALALEE